MAFARYFDKAALSAAALLQGFDNAAFRGVLQQHYIAVIFDHEAASNHEGRWTIELLVELLARLYPNLVIAAIKVSGETGGLFRSELVARAKAVNNVIDISEATEQATIALVVGATNPGLGIPTVFVGSDGWTVRTSSTAPVGVGTTDLPYGAGAAACLGAAAAFRRIFAAQLPVAPQSTPPDTDPDATEFSLLDFSPGPASAANFAGPVDVGDTYLVGLGAIGNGVIWALARTPGMIGQLNLVDPERIELTNLQRYVLADETDEGTLKTAIGKRALDEIRGPARSSDGKIVVREHPADWATFANGRGDYHFDRVLLALDSARDRIAAQASLPRWIANAWTQAENLGVSRNEFLGDAPCVACLYLPTGPQKSFDALVAEALRAREGTEQMEIRTLLYYRSPVGAGFIERVAERLGVPVEPLLPFAESSLESFYLQALCGGLVLRLGGEVGASAPVEVPMAFQSALAGVLLAVELVADAGRLRTESLPARTELDLRRPLRDVVRWPHSPAKKDALGRCICQDVAYQKVYRTKYRLPAAEAGVG